MADMKTDYLLWKLINDVKTEGRRTHFITLEDPHGVPSLLIADYNYWNQHSHVLEAEALKYGAVLEGMILRFDSEESRTCFVLKYG